MQEERKESLDATDNCSPPPANLYPEQNPGQDRILEQLTYHHCLNSTSQQKSNQSEPLNILLWEGSLGWEHISLQSGRTVSCMIISTLIPSTLHSSTKCKNLIKFEFRYLSKNSASLEIVRSVWIEQDWPMQTWSCSRHPFSGHPP